MKTVIEMAQEVWSAGGVYVGPPEKSLAQFAELVRADERNRLADKLQQDFKGAFGADTCASWAAWIKEQK